MTVTEQVLQKIVELTLEENERLPSERALADSCRVSRTSIRNTLKDLQARRILKVKRGSGYFLASQFALEQAIAGEDDRWDVQRVCDTMEARRHLEPYVIAISADKITETSIRQLEACLVALGEATVGHRLSRAVQLHRTFLEIVQKHCPNREFIRMLNEVRVPHNFSVKVIEAASDQERNDLFSDHVNLFQFIKSRDIRQIETTCQNINLKTTELLTKYADTINF